MKREKKQLNKRKNNWFAMVKSIMLFMESWKKPPEISIKKIKSNTSCGYAKYIHLNQSRIQLIKFYRTLT